MAMKNVLLEIKYLNANQNKFPTKSLDKFLKCLSVHTFSKLSKSSTLKPILSINSFE